MKIQFIVFVFSIITSAAHANLEYPFEEPLGFPKIYYHNLQQVQIMLKHFAQKNPQIAEYIEYGQSPQGHPFMALKISDHVELDENEPELLFTAATHGDEPISTEVLLGLIDRIHSGYGSDKRLTALVDDHEIFFIPVVNPDGFVKGFRLDNGNDPNRSYPYPGKPVDSMPPTPSIAALLQFFHSHDIKGSIDYHSSGEVILYPWAYTHEPMEEEAALAFNKIAKMMADTNGYMYGPIAQKMYISPGSSADYYFWKNGTLAFGVEIGKFKEPQIDTIEGHTDEQQEGLWQFIESF